jgi:cobalt-zinc-cadmium efflux system membrane fusion protein
MSLSNKSTRMFLKVITGCSLLFLLNACGSKKAETASETTNAENLVTITAAQANSAGIELVKMENKTISSVVKANGKIDVPPQNMISISSPLGGYLKSTKLLPGMPVRKGEVIATLEDQQFIQLQQDYLTAKAQFTLNQSEFNRQKELNSTKTTSDKVFEQTKANYQTQLILIKSLEEKLKLINLEPASISAETITRSINLYSPINGFVTTVNVNIGKYVTPSDILFELVNPDDIHLALTVFEKDLEKLSIGQPLVAYTNNDPEKKYPCHILLISKNVTDERSSIVHCHFDKADPMHIPGMFMNAEIEVKSANTSVLPDEAILRYENKFWVFYEKGKNSYQMTEISIGASENGYTEVIVPDSIKNESFVNKGAYNLLMTLKNTND